MNGVLLCAILLLGSGLQDRIPQPPDQYHSVDTYLEGRIVELTVGAGLIRLEPVDALLDRPPPSSPWAFARDRSTWVELRYARGWAYFENRDGGRQERLVLRSARPRLQVGQILEIGRGAGLPPVRRESGVAAGVPGPSGAAVTLRGWILVRVFPAED